MRPFLVFGGVTAVALASVATTWRTPPRLGLQADGRYLVSSGQSIDLVGRVLRLEGSRPKDTALSPDRRHVAVLSTRRLVLVDERGIQVADAAISAGPLGVAWSPSGDRIYATLGSGKIACFRWDGRRLEKLKELAVISADSKENVGLGGLAVGLDGRIYAALSIANAVVALSPEGEILWRKNVGLSPYHISISEGGDLLAVANRGGEPGSKLPKADSAGSQIPIDPRTDAALRGSVSLIDLPRGSVSTVEVGRQPSGLAFSPDAARLLVTESDGDAVSFIDVRERRVQGNLSIRPPEEPVFGQIPTDVAFSRDAKRAYVTLGGMNAVAVVDLGRVPRVVGYIPTPWYPIALESTSSSLVVAAAKGIGSRPATKNSGFGVHDSVGAIQSLDLNQLLDLKGLTARVAKNNGWIRFGAPRQDAKPRPIPERVGEPSRFRHVVYIIKENLTYDSTFGDMKEGNGDASLCTFGEEVTPNHHALAREFVLLDNFYISGTNSADGHQWVASSIANGYTEQNYAANARSYPYDGGDPLAFSPEGFLWTQARKSGNTVRVFGEFVDKPRVIDSKTGASPDWKRCWEDYRSGRNEIIVRAETSQAALQPVLHPRYIGFPSNVSDQWRADVFLGELQHWKETKRMPNLTIMLLPNDHTVGTRAGWPTPRAAVADNDLALGRIVEGLTNSPFWKDMLIVVAQDDSQLGLDHVDGHRSIALCISPYTRRGVVVSEFYNHGSIARTIGLALKMPPMTRFDRVGRPLTACFTDRFDGRTYAAKPNRVPLDELNPVPKSLVGEDRVLAEACGTMDWDELDTQNRTIVNRAVWRSTRPGEAYPAMLR